MSKLRQRGYLTEEVATVNEYDSPGGEEDSYSRSTKGFFRTFVKNLSKAIPSSFVEPGKKAKVNLDDQSAHIEGEAAGFTWNIGVNSRWMSHNMVDINVSVSSPKPRSITFSLNSGSNPAEVIEDVVAWMVAKTKKK